MIRLIINALIILGSVLMIVNIIGFIKYALFVKGRQKWNTGRGILYIPIVLLCFFFLGYMTVWIFGSPDIVMAGILFGGSIFVYIMHILLKRITLAIIENEELEIRIAAAEESTRAKNAFMAGVSHEMKTPMNVILGLDELALKRDDLPDETRLQLENIRKNGNHLLKLINDMLDYHKTDNALVKMRNETFYLRDVIDQLEAMVRPMCDEKGIEFKVETDDICSVGLMGDDILLIQILMYILDNAVKYTSAPGTVSLMTQQESSDNESCVIKFKVTDTGIGISKEFLPHIYELFSQEDTSFTNRFGGCGIGLNAAKNKVEMMHGEIIAESEPGEGSVFTVTIPFPLSKEGKTSGENKEAASEEYAGEVSELEGCRVLIVEDVDENAEIVADLLELEGVISERAENGEVACAMFEKSEVNYYDAILMDLRMPVMDGLESSKIIRGLERVDAKTVPIIALTANNFDVDKKNTAEAGMNDHLTKPIDSDVLYSTLLRWIKESEKAKGGNACD